MSKKELGIGAGIVAGAAITLILLIGSFLFLMIHGAPTTDISTKSSRSSSSSSRYYGSCKRYDDGTTTGCNGNDLCKIEDEWQAGDLHYFTGKCVKR